jgi:hypothetical protein
MQELTMNQAKDSFTSVRVNPEPLFASSWVALYSLLRRNFANGRNETETETENEQAGTGDMQH